MTARIELDALLEKAIEEAVAEAIAYNDKEWEMWARSAIVFSYALDDDRHLEIQAFDADDDFAAPLVQETLLNILSGEIDAVSEMPHIADNWIAALEEVVTAFRDAQRTATPA